MLASNGQHEEVEEVDIVRRVFVLKKHLRKKYRSDAGLALHHRRRASHSGARADSRDATDANQAASRSTCCVSSSSARS